MVFFSVHHGRNAWAVCPIIGDVFDHLDKVTSARVLQCNLTCFLFVINMYFVESSFETM